MLLSTLTSLQDFCQRLLSVPQGATSLAASPLTILGSTLACTLLYHFFQRTNVLCPKPGTLSRQEKAEWSWRLVGTIHAVVVVIGATMTYLESSSWTTKQHIIGYGFAPDFFGRIFLGYLLYDLAILVCCDFTSLKDGSSIIHHVLYIATTSYVLAYSIMGFPFSWLGLTEITTPLINLRWHLAVLARKDTPLYLINGLLMALLFFWVRVVLYGAGLLHTWSLREHWAVPSVPLAHKLFMGFFVTGWLLNCYWMLIIAKGVYRAVTGDRGDEIKGRPAAAASQNGVKQVAANGNCTAHVEHMNGVDKKSK